MRIEIKISIIILLATMKSYGQIDNLIYAFGSDNLNEIDLEKFKLNNFKKLKVYNFKISKRGKAKKDSLLIKEIQFDARQNILRGMDFNLGIQSHSGVNFTWYKYENHYDQDGKIVKEISKFFERFKKKRIKKNNYKSTGYNEINHVYNKKGVLITKIDKSISEDRFEGIKKVFQSFNIKSRIYEYEYELVNRFLIEKEYITKDSTKYYDSKNFNSNPNSVKCNYCREKYLSSIKEYDENMNLISWTTFTKDQDMHTKHIYEYNSDNKILRQIDSTGWYLGSIKPYLESYSEYLYKDSITEIRKTYPISWNNSTPNFETKILDRNDVLIKECSSGNSLEKCTEYTYYTEKGKITNQVSELQSGVISSRKIKYNSKGDISEESRFVDNKLVSRIKYYYE